MDKKKPADAKIPRWKQTEDDRARLRILYRYMITHKAKKGMTFRYGLTPLELKQRSEHTEEELLLFDLYIENRYDERSIPPTLKINSLKASFEKKWGIK